MAPQGSHLAVRKTGPFKEKTAPFLQKGDLFQNGAPREPFHLPYFLSAPLATVLYSFNHLFVRVYVCTHVPYCMGYKPCAWVCSIAGDAPSAIINKCH